MDQRNNFTSSGQSKLTTLSPTPLNKHLNPDVTSNFPHRFNSVSPILKNRQQLPGPFAC